MTREYKLQEVKKHNNQDSLWMIIHNDVYDVTKFIDEHPGGAESLLDFAGDDGTQAFEDVAHSDDARELMKSFKIGTLCVEDRKAVNVPCCLPNVKKKKSEPLTLFNRDWFVYAVNSCCDDPKPEKTWRNYDGSPERPSSPKSPRFREQATPSVERRVNAIIVPRERYRRRSSVPPSPPPPRGSRLKWALVALAGALVIGFVVKKYMAQG